MILILFLTQGQIKKKLKTIPDQNFEILWQRDFELETLFDNLAKKWTMSECLTLTYFVSQGQSSYKKDCVGHNIKLLNETAFKIIP